MPRHAHIEPTVGTGDMGARDRDEVRTVQVTGARGTGIQQARAEQGRVPVDGEPDDRCLAAEGIGGPDDVSTVDDARQLRDVEPEDRGGVD